MWICCQSEQDPQLRTALSLKWISLNRTRSSEPFLAEEIKMPSFFQGWETSQAMKQRGAIQATQTPTPGMNLFQVSYTFLLQSEVLFWKWGIWISMGIF